MKKQILTVLASSLFIASFASAKRPPLAFSCNAKMGDLLGQVQMFASGHSRFVFKKEGTKKVYACWLQTQYVNDQRQAQPGGLVADYLRSESCKPEMDRSIKRDIPEQMRLAISKPLNTKPHAVIAAEGMPGSYICDIKDNKLGMVNTFANGESGAKKKRDIASDENSGFPNIEIWYQE